MSAEGITWDALPQRAPRPRRVPAATAPEPVLAAQPAPDEPERHDDAAADDVDEAAEGRALKRPRSVEMRDVSEAGPSAPQRVIAQAAWREGGASNYECERQELLPFLSSRVAVGFLLKLSRRRWLPDCTLLSWPSKLSADMDHTADIQLHSCPPDARACSRSSPRATSGVPVTDVRPPSCHRGEIDRRGVRVGSIGAVQLHGALRTGSGLPSPRALLPDAFDVTFVRLFTVLTPRCGTTRADAAERNTLRRGAEQALQSTRRARRRGIMPAPPLHNQASKSSQNNSQHCNLGPIWPHVRAAHDMQSLLFAYLDELLFTFSTQYFTCKCGGEGAACAPSAVTPTPPARAVKWLTALHLCFPAGRREIDIVLFDRESWTLEAVGRVPLRSSLRCHSETRSHHGGEEGRSALDQHVNSGTLAGGGRRSASTSTSRGQRCG